jgi:hypothetical protein
MTGAEYVGARTVCECGESRPHLHGDFTLHDGSKSDVYVLPQESDIEEGSEFDGPTCV